MVKNLSHVYKKVNQKPKRSMIVKIIEREINNLEEDSWVSPSYSPERLKKEKEYLKEIDQYLENQNIDEIGNIFSPKISRHIKMLSKNPNIPIQPTKVGMLAQKISPKEAKLAYMHHTNDPGFSYTR